MLFFKPCTSASGYANQAFHGNTKARGPGVEVMHTLLVLGQCAHACELETDIKGTKIQFSTGAVLVLRAAMLGHTPSPYHHPTPAETFSFSFFTSLLYLSSDIILCFFFL